jgi:hypothetical protein
MKFRIGDRVAVYGFAYCKGAPVRVVYGDKAKVVSCDDDSFFRFAVSFDASPYMQHEVHPKQCRRLRNKALGGWSATNEKDAFRY